MRDQPREPRTYELMTILSPDVPEEEIPGQLERISGYVTSVGGAIQDTRRDSPWGRRRLAYPIRHAGRDLRDGFYTLFHIELAPNRVDDVERELKLNPQLMRYLITHYTPQPLDPRAVEDAEIAAEDAAAEAYAAAQAEAAHLAAGGGAEQAPAPEPAAAAEEPTAPKEEPAAAAEQPATAEVAVPEPTVTEADAGAPVAIELEAPETASVEDATAAEAATDETATADEGEAPGEAGEPAPIVQIDSDEGPEEER